ncbi:MAG TPA: hypothetical protein VK778_11035 [Solirubrobacteraceae bacterium]|jgi:hypothetical protein|nr:hypothetical protein [Solirubrobacteraceae bacterium]
MNKTDARFTPIWRRAAVIGSLLLVAAAIAGCGATASADVKDCLASSPVSFEQTQGQPRTYKDLELTVSCSPGHSFELTELKEGEDYPVLAVQHGGKDTCLHRRFKAKGERCVLELAFEPSNKPGAYSTYFYFQYAGEDETFIATATGTIAPA